MKLSSEEIRRYENMIAWQSRFSRFVIQCSRICRETLGLDFTQVRILAAVAHDPMRSVGYYCAKLSLRASTVSMALKSLEELGYIDRMSSQIDARSVDLRLTEDGIAVLVRCLKSFERINELMNRDLQEGAYKSVCGLICKGGLHDFLVRVVDFDEIHDTVDYSHLRTVVDYESVTSLIETGLAAECVANLICILGHTWADSGLNMRSGRILSHVFLQEERGVDEVGASDLREVLLMQPAEVSSGVMKLEQDGLVVRERGELDRRMTMVSLTKKGRSLAQSALKANLAKLEETSPGFADVDPLTCYKA